MARPRPATPTALVVFGATGDLMERKIAPALLHLHLAGRLPERFCVIGFARRPFTNEEFRARIEAHVRDHSSHAPTSEQVRGFLSVFSYAQGTFDDAAAYESLAAKLRETDENWGVCARKLYHLAVPPDNYATILERLATSRLNVTCDAEAGETRVLIEKPFGRDAGTAQQIDEMLAQLFSEEQIYRIDHYLAKEMLQGIMTFRFANTLLEPSWNAGSVASIEVDLLETAGLEGRADSYDGVGALRDVGQNHLLQMLALVTMARPANTTAEEIRAARADALRALAPLDADRVAHATFRAQYAGYTAEEGVAPDSTTETFFQIATELDSPAWAGVPVVLRAGKRLGSVCKRVRVTFDAPPACMCPVGPRVANSVDFVLEPEERITISFWARKPGLDEELESRRFDFQLREAGGADVEAYPKLLEDAIRGDQTLFVSTAEVEAMWSFIDPVVRGWEAGAVPLARYEPGSDEVLEVPGSAGRMAADALRREIGVVGLGKMGAGLARNLLDHGWRVVGFNRTPGVAAAMEADGLVAVDSLEALAAELAPPRTVWVMVDAGAVERVVFSEGGVASVLDPGDVLIDGGNSHYIHDADRHLRLAEDGVRFVDVGTSGGPDGARHGACLMIGGRVEDFERLRPLWRDVSVPGGYRFFAGAGAGHFVKMVHNGIEYGMMQAIAEGFTVLRASEYSLDLTEAADVFDHGSVIESRLIEWLWRALRLHGQDLAGVSGTVAATGEGAWTVDAADELGVEARVIAEALEFRRRSVADPSWTGRVLSALREQFGRHDAAERPGRAEG